jgi:hypothetical protein
MFSQNNQEDWFVSLEQVWHRYHAATREHRKLLRRTPTERLGDPDSSLARARRAQDEALNDYLQVLRNLSRAAAEDKPPEGLPWRL